ncbi:hypothetical protein ASPVEDRAFT_87129 [Aspergillus versicolor CBS 583.65]|uniref:FAD-binding PCMH-type domain-containing protein n=1 Tax=Aspergillus versicolor CBS 583.65 TaxID=1036611 RepID=A0A1L9PWG6_ASPVE|nr:uncharacterized protein ASPVEDRAFT_87129 [Aspergillus versicolor CBS 583.65]OJJ05795.1 hypothetical protein ASPVEDRAFT_87129 [Aspergillus versicolor CBS 583.65]
MYLRISVLAISFVVVFIILKNTISTYNSGRRSCRCLPHEPCWPSTNEWNIFNESINGHLVHLRPVGAICHGKEFDQDACNFVQENANNSVWRASEPATLQSANWESSWEECGSCDITSYIDEPCHQGRVPLYAVLAEFASEIQTAVRFAKQRNIRLVVKNTGHDSMGRSSGPGSLQINTNRLKGIDVVSDFIPQGGSVSLGQAATLGAGTLALEISQVAEDEKFNVLLGLCTTVGVAGGFIQGGGASLLGPTHGMASDNALEFNVVTAEGDLVVANEFQNPDLFWALRGGGGGTFGITVNTTIRTFPDIPGIVFTLTAAISRQDEQFSDTDAALWEFATAIVNILPSLKGADSKTGAAIVSGIQEDGVQLVTEILFPNTTDTTSIGAKLAPLLARLDDLGFSIVYTTNTTLYPQISTYFNQPRLVDLAGTGRIEGSVLISSSLFFSPGGTSQIMNVVSNLTYRVGDLIEIFLSGGGQVHANKDLVNSALHPHWRESEMLVTYRRTMPLGATAKHFVDSQMPFLRALETPRMGSFLNTADPDEPDFQRAFWGDNYARLLKVKRRWDRDGLFIVNLGVGSEGWDKEGICWTGREREYL